jgi:hypothetical protein
MAIKKVKSKDYLDYLGGKGCVVSGRRPSDIHHESIVRKYSGGMKKYFDFGAVPLDHEIHLYERHGWGKTTFWEHYKLDPVSIVVALVQEYIEQGREDAELATNALDMIKRDNGYHT